MTSNVSGGGPEAGGDPAVPSSQPVTVGGLGLRIIGEQIRAAVHNDGSIEVEAESSSGDVQVEWSIPCVDVVALWTTDATPSYWLPTDWSAPRNISLVSGAPVAALIGSRDLNRCTFASMQTEIVCGGGVSEETGEFRFRVSADRVLRLRIDLSGRHYARCLADVAAWWGIETTAQVPSVARMPTYSTWYTLHQAVSPESIEKQAAAAKALGCDAVIVDDGWMTSDRQRGYAYTGDWEPTSLPDVAAHVDRVHSMGLAYLLWYAIPFVGKHSAAYQAMQRYALLDVDRLNAIVVDPRYPVVRTYLADRLARAVEEWGMDGLKIDFIDQFGRGEPPTPLPEADCERVEDGVRLLLADIHRRVTAVRSDAMIEHRQPYCSPGLWPYATMVRAGDCPLSTSENRQQTISLRLVSGPIAVHSDMIMWHHSARPEEVATALINVLFAVPQISVDLTTLPDGQRAALAFWLDFFRRYVDVLQLSSFEPARPDLGYPLVRARTDDIVIVARYGPLPLELPDDDWSELLLANADDPTVPLVPGPSRTVQAEIHDAQGRLIDTAMIDLSTATSITVPTGGLLKLS